MSPSTPKLRGKCPSTASNEQRTLPTRVYPEAQDRRVFLFLKRRNMTMNIIKTEEVNMLSDLFTRFANTVTQASDLSVKMEQAHKDLDALRSDIQTVRDENKRISDELADVREARDKARRERDEYESQLKVTQDTLNNATLSIENYRVQRDENLATIETLRKERDDYGMKALAETERADKAEAILKDLRDRLGIGPVDLPPLSPTSAPTSPPVSPASEGAQSVSVKEEPAPGYRPFEEPVAQSSDPAPAAIGTGPSAPAAEPAKPERVYLDHSVGQAAVDRFWREGTHHQWDADKSSWYYEKPVAA